MTESRRYAASVVGGGSGGNLSMRALVASDRYELVAAADISEAARRTLAKSYPSICLYDSHETMFANLPTDVVCVATWPPSHQQVVVDALGSGVKGLLCEKPIGDTWATGEATLGAIRAANLPVVVPHGLLRLRHGEEILQRVHRETSATWSWWRSSVPSGTSSTRASTG